MDDCLIAALINARVAEAHIKLEAMRAQNLYRLHKGEMPEYSYDDFTKVTEECGINHNGVYGLIQDYQNR
jgi:hypothetical protein